MLNISPFIARERKPGRTNILRPFTCERLGELDILNKLGGHIEMEEWCEPAVQLQSFVDPLCPEKLVQCDCLIRKCTHQTCYPSSGPDKNALKCKVIDTGEDSVAVPHKIENVGNAPDVVR